MAKSCNQKLKILYLMELLKEKSQRNEMSSMQEIIDFLAQKGIQAERKSIYDDMDALRVYGMDIRYNRKRPGGYYLVTDGAEESQINPPKKAENFQTQHEKDGETKRLKLLCEKKFQPQVENFFGRILNEKEKEEEQVILTVEHTLDLELYGWLAAMGKQVKLVKPKKVSAAFRDHLKSVLKEYKES
ncbi:MAG TPA: WYL domain-containing protein [Candidatus Blautia intestinigallinarum]|nr:WYL domain-containing protein [Candidatus Blautia intestinigallinarum]